MHLFTYGTLMFPQVWDRVVPRRFATATGVVTGFRVRRVVGGLYPVMFAADSAEEVTGLVYLDVDDESIALLDAYESTLYDRVAVTARGQLSPRAAADSRRESATEIVCQAYILPSRNLNSASDEPWTSEWFVAHAIDEYLRYI